MKVRVGEQTKARMLDLGLDEEVFRQGALEGQVARGLVDDDFDPGILKGIVPWGKTFGAVCRRLVSSAWTHEEIHNLPMIVSPTRHLAIVVVTGDDATGWAERTPQTKAPRGRMSDWVISVNNRQLALALDDVAVPAGEPSKKETLTYFFLYRRHRREIRCELSLPSAIGRNLRVSDWEERLIIGRVDMGPAPARREKPAPSTDLDVRRKTA